VTALLWHLWLHVIMAALLTAAAVALWVPSANARLWARGLLVAGLGVGAVSIGLRWWITGHPPVFGTFENAIASSWTLGLVVLLLATKRFEWVPRRVAQLVGVWIPATLVYGAFFPHTPYPLTISERNILVDVHVFFAWVAYAALIVASMSALALLLDRAGTDEAVLDAIVFRGLGIGFATFSLMMVAGSIYTYQLFGDWFRWEFVETLCAAAWLAYGAALHARLLFGWRGRRLAWLAVALLPLLVAAFWAWSLYPATYHYFEIPELKAR
jgi:ABC-type transport system involved in cytochrome c biogenesis permease subunit